MSWKRFDGLNVSEQQEVLKVVFRKTGLMYTVDTLKGYTAVKNEYHAFDSVKMFIDEAMEEVLSNV